MVDVLNVDEATADGDQQMARPHKPDALVPAELSRASRARRLIQSSVELTAAMVAGLDPTRERDGDLTIAAVVNRLIEDSVAEQRVSGVPRPLR